MSSQIASTGGLFRRAPLWPWVVGVFLLAAGLGVAAGLTVLDDKPPRELAVVSPSEAPEPTPAPEPTSAVGGSSSSPMPTSADATSAPATGVLPRPAPTPSTSPALGPSRSASPSPAVSRTPTASRTPSAAPTTRRYPPPGLRLQLTTASAGGGRARIRIRVTDTDGSWNGGRIDYGDGTGEEFPQGVASCASPDPTPPPYRAAPSDRTMEITHTYPAAGTYDVFVRVRSDRPCEGTPVEEVSDVEPVTVDDPTSGPTPAPALS